MSTTPNPEVPQITRRQARRTLLIVGAVALFFSIYLLAFLLPDVIRNAVGPESMTVARAAEVAGSESTYVKLDDGAWHCDTVEYVRGPSSTNRRRIITRNTEIFYTDSASLPQIVVFVTESGEKTCADFQLRDPNGYLTRMSSGTQQELANEVRLAQFPGATDYLELCAYCGPDNSLIGVGFGFFFAIAGVVALVAGLRIRAEGTTEAEQS